MGISHPRSNRGKPGYNNDGGSPALAGGVQSPIGNSNPLAARSNPTTRPSGSGPEPENTGVIVDGRNPNGIGAGGDGGPGAKALTHRLIEFLFPKTSTSARQAILRMPGRPESSFRPLCRN